MIKSNTQNAIRAALAFARQANTNDPEAWDDAIADFERAYPIPIVDFDAPPLVCSLEIPLLMRNESCGKCGHPAHIHTNWPHHNPKHPNYRREFNT